VTTSALNAITRAKMIPADFNFTRIETQTYGEW